MFNTFFKNSPAYDIITLRNQHQHGTGQTRKITTRLLEILHVKSNGDRLIIIDTERLVDKSR